jgi:hypothetical protein
MESNHKLRNLRAILAVTEENLAGHKAKAVACDHELKALYLRTKEDPAHKHLFYSAVGRVYLEREHLLEVIHICEGSCLRLSKQIDLLPKE